MNILSQKKLDNAVVELEIEIPVDKVEQGYKSVFIHLQKISKVDGFRVGKAPQHMIELKFKDQADDEVAKNLVNESIYQAIEQNNLSPIVEPRIEYKSISRDNPFIYTAFFEVMPTVELGEYVSVSAGEKKCLISDEDVQSEIDTIRERYTDIIEVTDPDAVVENGHFLNIHIKRIDDKSAEEAEVQEFNEITVTVGKKKDDEFIDRHFIGMKKGELKEITVKYPENYHVADIAGKELVYLVKILLINTVKYPELTDDFAKNAGYESADDLKVKTRTMLENFVKDRITKDVRSEIVNKIITESKFDIPESMVINEMASIFGKIQERLGAKVTNLAQFATALGMDPDEYRTRLRNEALKSIKTTIALSEIARRENMQVEEERYKEVVTNSAKSMGRTYEEVASIIEKNQTRDNIEHDILLEKALTFVYDKANITVLPEISLQDFINNRAV